MLEVIRSSLSLLASGVRYSSTMEEPHEFTTLLAQTSLAVLSQIQHHDLWCAACIVHPGLNSFHFMPRGSASECRRLSESLVQKLVQELSCEQQSEVDKSSIQVQEPQRIRTGNSLDQRQWGLANSMSFLTTPKRKENNELFDYLNLSLTKSEIELIKTDEGIVEFWLSKRDHFPQLRRVSLRILVTPASSSPSERDFSMLKLLVTPSRNHMKDEVINAVGQIRSMYA